MSSGSSWPKTILVFFLGASTSALILGALFLTVSKKESFATTTASSPMVPPVSLPPAALEKPQTTDRTAVETPLFQSFLSAEPSDQATVYEVQSGDNLTRISKKYQVTVDVLKKANQLPNDVLKIGMKLKIPTQRLSVVVDKSQNTLILKAGEDVMKTYPVSTGSNNSTPVGVFKITDKLIDPTWYSAGAVVPSGSPDNVLGTRWLGINSKGYGIHGTVEPEKIGQQVTAGCVRMRNEAVEELYSLVPTGTEVTIVD